jgi:hypothetical protein
MSPDTDTLWLQAAIAEMTTARVTSVPDSALSGNMKGQSAILYGGPGLKIAKSSCIGFNGVY